MSPIISIPNPWHFLSSILGLLALVLIQPQANAQNGNFIIEGQPVPQLRVLKKIDDIKVDGVLDEETWQKVESISHYSQYFPLDSISAVGDTEVYMCYDDDHFYIAAKCYSSGSNFRVETLRRDFSFRRTDNISFIFDTYNDRTNAFQFSMNVEGAQKEALISSGGKSSQSFDQSWDNKWTGDSKQYDGYWICEMAIPFSSIRYKEGITKWGFNSYRNDLQINETSCLVRIPRENNLLNLNYTADLIWEEPLSNPGRNISLIPFISTSTSRNYENAQENQFASSFSYGGDAKIGVSSSLNLDLTVNPDFSQVEVDQQVNNLGRFEISLPEKRQFFQENADLFSGFGNDRLNPFFSRRIGVSIDTLTENNVQNTIYGGARLSGKLNDNLRIGMLSMVTASQRENDLPSFNYTVIAGEQQVFDRSNIGFIMVSKQGINTSDFGGTVNDYNRIAGLEYRLNSQDNVWTGKTSFMKSFTPDDKAMKYSAFSRLEYNKRRFRVELAGLVIGDGMDAEVGFVPRKDFLLLSPEFDIRFFPKTEKISQTTLLVDSRFIYKLGKDNNPIIEDFGHEETQVTVDYNIRFTQNQMLEISADYQQFTLLRNFDPTRVQDSEVFFSPGTNHENLHFSIEYGSDERKVFSYEFQPNMGRYFGGLRAGLNGELTYRFRPKGSVSLDYSYTYIDIGGKFKEANLWLVGPRVDVTFTKNVFWTTFIQYNNRLDNLNINSRFQWRFAPVSDFFLVYTDNYNTLEFSNLRNRNKAIVAKLTYWFNK